jgi:hypothetical protein
LNAPFLFSGSGYLIRIHLSRLNLSPEYIAVNHSQYNDNEAFKGDAQIKTEYCPYPMPEMYDLGVLVHHVSKSYKQA